MKRIVETYEKNKILLAKIPVMIQSNYCHLKNLDKQERVRNAKDCFFDQGGYFVINGGEKVIVAQERMASNIVLVFNRKGTSKYSWVCEIRSQGEGSKRPPQQVIVALRAKKGGGTLGAVKDTYGHTIVARIPWIRDEIPICILFRALGCTSDRQILSRIYYSEDDADLMEAMKPSLEDSMSVLS